MVSRGSMDWIGNLWLSIYDVIKKGFLDLLPPFKTSQHMYGFAKQNKVFVTKVLKLNMTSYMNSPFYNTIQILIKNLKEILKLWSSESWKSSLLIRVSQSRNLWPTQFFSHFLWNFSTTKNIWFVLINFYELINELIIFAFFLFLIINFNFN